MITYTVIPAIPQDDITPLQPYAKWRMRRVSVQEATQQVGEDYRWLQFCNELQPGDELWAFNSNLGRYAARPPHTGFYAARGGRVVNVFTTWRG